MEYKILACYLILINIVGFCVMLSDKRRARAGRYRIPEKSLFAVAAVGGSVGSILGMLAFRHKTKHISFTLGMPMILLLQLGLVYLAVRIF